MVQGFLAAGRTVSRTEAILKVSSFMKANEVWVGTELLLPCQ